MTLWLSEGAAPGGIMGIIAQFWFIPVLILIFWFMVFRPERQKAKKHKEMLDAIAKNDKVVTVGGLYGIVKSINENEVMLLVDEKNGTTLKFLRSAIRNKITGDEAKGELTIQQ